MRGRRCCSAVILPPSCSALPPQRRSFLFFVACLACHACVLRRQVLELPFTVLRWLSIPCADRVWDGMRCTVRATPPFLRGHLGAFEGGCWVLRFSSLFDPAARVDLEL